MAGGDVEVGAADAGDAAVDHRDLGVDVGADRAAARDDVGQVRRGVLVDRDAGGEQRLVAVLDQVLEQLAVARAVEERAVAAAGQAVAGEQVDADAALGGGDQRQREIGDQREVVHHDDALARAAEQRVVARERARVVDAVVHHHPGPHVAGRGRGRRDRQLAAAVAPPVGREHALELGHQRAADPGVGVEPRDVVVGRGVVDRDLVEAQVVLVGAVAAGDIADGAVDERELAVIALLERHRVDVADRDRIAGPDLDAGLIGERGDHRVGAAEELVAGVERVDHQPHRDPGGGAGAQSRHQLGGEAALFQDVELQMDAARRSVEVGEQRGARGVVVELELDRVAVDGRGAGHDLVAVRQRVRTGGTVPRGHEARGGVVERGQPARGRAHGGELRQRQRRQAHRGRTVGGVGARHRGDQRHARGADPAQQQARVDRAEVDAELLEVLVAGADRQHRRRRPAGRGELRVTRRHRVGRGQLDPAQGHALGVEPAQRRQRGRVAVEQAGVGHDHRAIAHHLQPRDRRRRHQHLAIGGTHRRGHDVDPDRGRRVAAHRRR